MFGYYQNLSRVCVGRGCRLLDPEPTSGPPALDLANRDLVEAHLHAVWLAREQIDANHVFQGTQF